jgi:FdhD protein
VIGHLFLSERLPVSEGILLVSGRVSFELMQKALAAGIPCVAAISAPTTAAVEFAHASGQTLVGFLRGERMNVYAGTLGG